MGTEKRKLSFLPAFGKTDRILERDVKCCVFCTKEGRKRKGRATKRSVDACLEHLWQVDFLKAHCYHNLRITEEMEMRVVFSLLMDNTPGVLSRIAGLFTRRGYNIESITAGVTADPRYTRMTVVSNGDDDVLEQIEKQIRKLEDVKDIKRLPEDKSVYRELMMVKIRANADQRESVHAVVQIFRASIVDVAKSSLTIMLTGDQKKLDALLALLEEYEILELARTGITGLARGADDIKYLP